MQQAEQRPNEFSFWVTTDQPMFVCQTFWSEEAKRDLLNGADLGKLFKHAALSLNQNNGGAMKQVK